MMKKLNALYKGTFYDESNLSPKQFGVLLLKYFVLQTTLVFGGGTLLCQALAANGSNTFILKIAFAIL